MRRKPSERERHLEWEVAALREQIARLRADPPDIPFSGCDHSCVVAQVKGMATNAGCRCNESTLRRAVLYWRKVAAHRLESIEQLRSMPLEPNSDTKEIAK